MSKPDDIPQDIWDLAERLPIISENFDDGDLMIVARALMTAKAEAYEDAAKMIEEGFDRVVGEPYADDGSPSKNDKCPHNRYMYEDCETCCVDAIRTKASEVMK